MPAAPRQRSHAPRLLPTEKQKLFETTVKVDTLDVPVAVYEGDSPADVATTFAQTHKLDQDGAMAVFYHLKQKAAQNGLMKRVLYYQPFIAEIGGEKKMMNMTVYEDSDPAGLAVEAGNTYGLPPNQQGQLKVAIESQVLQRVKLRIPIDMSANGVGKQLLLVLHNDDAVSSTKRFAEEMKNMGITLSDEGLQSIAQGVQKQLLTKQAESANALAAAIEANKK